MHKATNQMQCGQMLWCSVGESTGIPQENATGIELMKHLGHVVCGYLCIALLAIVGTDARLGK